MFHPRFKFYNTLSLILSLSLFCPHIPATLLLLLSVLGPSTQSQQSLLSLSQPLVYTVNFKAEILLYEKTGKYIIYKYERNPTKFKKECLCHSSYLCPQQQDDRTPTSGTTLSQSLSVDSWWHETHHVSPCHFHCWRHWEKIDFSVIFSGLNNVRFHSGQKEKMDIR